MTNGTEQSVGPFYVNYVFHDSVLSEWVGHEQYSAMKRIGMEGIVLKPGETHQGGDNLEIRAETIDPAKLKDIVETQNAVEIQLVHTDTNEVLASYRIRQFAYVDHPEA